MRTLVLVDDPHFCTLLFEVLRKERCQVIGLLAHHGSARAEVERPHARIDLVVVDLTLPRSSAAVRIVLENHPAARVLVVVPPTQPALAVPALRNGARGAVLSDVTATELRGTISFLRAGEFPIAPRVNRAMIDALREGEWARHPSGLTRRERDVLATLVDGLTYTQSAKILGIGTGTVQSHVKKIYEKLDVRSRAQATELAIRAKLLAS
jgi:two-component system, NarL family, nitrate/nitrite response regulator NarL